MVRTGLTQDILLDLYAEKERYITIAFSYLHDREKARDVFSDAFTYIFERRDSLEGGLSQMKAYMMQTVRHRCLNELKRDSIRQETFRNILEEDMKALATDNVSQRILAKDIKTVIDNAGLRLQKRTFDIFVASRVGGLSHKELSKMFGITEGRVAKEIMKAAKVFNNIIRQYFQILIAVVPYFGSLLS